MHLLERYRRTHQTQKPAIDKKSTIYSQSQHMLIKSIKFGLNQLLNASAMNLQVLQATDIDHPQLLILHHLNQGPKGLFRRFYMKQQHSSYHIHPLHVTQLHIIHTVTYQNLLQHFSKIHISAKGRTISMSSVNILLNLNHILVCWLCRLQKTVRFVIILVLILCPLQFPRTGISTLTSLLS